ncbi:type IV pili methyl-accepting chemotaxis transducer N-terminal domain-containing protein [Profundibacter sp.]|uniref:type IV pili methyl-accepting chemotaxis transducer N-terminal domain-containing protein n=1 Tax=Profundibacter sp. TaxID=3101071 RepID=UPI003D0BFE10
MVYSGNPESAVQALDAASAEFGKILIALKDGDPEMGILGAEEKRRTLAKLDELTALWEPFHAAINDLRAGKDIDTSMAHLSENNMALLGAAKALVTEETAEYANPFEMTAEDALLIDFAGRQRMLTQKIAKESCGIETGNAALGTMDDMKATVSMFELTLGALRDGMPAAGVKAPPTGEIHDSLVAATDDWNEAKSLLDGVTE